MSGVSNPKKAPELRQFSYFEILVIFGCISLGTSQAQSPISMNRQPFPQNWQSLGGG